MNTIKIITTHDGSPSLWNEELQEAYHSRHGAIQESVHVFIKQGLDQVGHLPTVRVLEIGLGTGLNAWLTASWAIRNQKAVQYYTLERYPVPDSIWRQLNYTQVATESTLFQNIHLAPWQQWSQLNSYFSIYKAEESLQEVVLKDWQVDLIYFDAFAPNKQPEMWELPILQKVIATLSKGGVFVTYCAKGQLKRDLKSFEMKVESLPGPPGKREMVRAIKL